MSRRAYALAGLLALLAVPESEAGAQMFGADGKPSPFVKDYKVDFAIPDAPAFKLLDTDQSSILRPQTVKDITMALDGFRGTNNSFTIPSQFAIEVSPGLLVSGKTLRIATYGQRLQKFLYATRLSGATNRDSLNRAQFAAGSRFTFVDQQDLRVNGGAGDTAVTRFTRSILAVYNSVKDRKNLGPGVPIVLDASDKAIVEAIADSIKSYWKDQYWNATSFEVAFAGRARGIDSTGHNPKMQEVAAWATYANGIGGWGQILFGAKLGSARDALGKLRSESTVSGRLYLGANDLKLFFEGQQAVQSASTAQRLFNSGVEVNVPGLGWLTGSGGYSTDPAGGKGKLISSFKVKTGVL